MKVGLVFGSFNPCHLGHLYLAESAIKAHGLDQVWFMLQTANPYKEQPEILSVDSRMAMLRLLTQSHPQLKVHVLSTTHLADSVKALKSHYGYEFHLILGDDLAASLSSWPDYDEIRKLNMITIKRQTNYSSHIIRDCIARNKPFGNYVPPSIEHFIRQNNLYKA